jgi:hypothetical protein
MSFKKIEMEARMYKPNGEEPMSKQEELRRRESIAARIAARSRERRAGEAERGVLYAALYKSAVTSEVALGLGETR